MKRMPGTCPHMDLARRGLCVTIAWVPATGRWYQKAATLTPRPLPKAPISCPSGLGGGPLSLPRLELPFVLGLELTLLFLLKVGAFRD